MENIWMMNMILYTYTMFCQPELKISMCTAYILPQHDMGESFSSAQGSLAGTDSCQTAFSQWSFVQENKQAVK